MGVTKLQVRGLFSTLSCIQHENIPMNGMAKKITHRSCQGCSSKLGGVYTPRGSRCKKCLKLYLRALQKLGDRKRGSDKDQKDVCRSDRKRGIRLYVSDMLVDRPTTMQPVRQKMGVRRIPILDNQAIIACKNYLPLVGWSTVGRIDRWMVGGWIHSRSDG